MATIRLHGLDQLPENGTVSQASDIPNPKPLLQVDQTVLPFLGGFGRYQKRLVALTWIPTLLIAFGQFSDYFLLAQPDSICAHPDEHGINVSGVSELIGSPVPPNLLSNSSRAESVSSRCLCAERKLELQLGLQQNVVTKVGKTTRTSLQS